ncbi:hypothetical protein ACNKHL_15580 [Shigella flexneri]
MKSKLLKATAPATANRVWKMGLGQEKRRDDGIPALLTISFQKSAARGRTNAGRFLLSSESWQEVSIKPLLTSRR